MANFETSFRRTLAFEGGWANDPDDLGGETYAGISRRHSGNWIGWVVIDAFREGSSDLGTFKRGLASSEDLQHLVAEFYRARFWLPIRGDSLTSQALADRLFDCAVNLGLLRTVKFLQDAINLLSREESSVIARDGKLGPVTLAAIGKLVSSKEGEQDLCKMLLLLRGAHYLRIVGLNPHQRKFLRGWLRRLS